MTDCPNCEYHRQRAQRWRDEAYRQAGHPLPEREWVGLTDEDKQKLAAEQHDWEGLCSAVEAKLKEKNG
jgi:hypothetical protein